MKVIITGLEKRPYLQSSDEHLFEMMSNNHIDETQAKRAFHEFNERYGNYVWHNSLRLCRAERSPTDTAIDICRQTMYNAYQNAGSYKKKTTTKAWLGRIATNLFADYMRANADLGKIRYVEDYDEYSYTDEKDIKEEEWFDRTPIESQKFLKAWQELEPHKREVLRTYLRYFDKKDFGENCHLPKFEVEDLCKAFPTVLKDKYYLPKVRDRAFEELYKKCQGN